jgi:hypothetical protein
MQTLQEAAQGKIKVRNSCLSHRELFQYADGKLAEKVKRKVEMHLLECEKCISLYQQVLNKKETTDKSIKYADLFPEGGNNKFEIDSINFKKIFTVAAVLVGVIVLYGAYSKFAKLSVKNDNAYSPISNQLKEPDRVTSPVVDTEENNNVTAVNNNKASNEKNEVATPANHIALNKREEVVENKIAPIAIEPKKPVEKTNKTVANVSTPVVPQPEKIKVPVKDSVVKIPAVPIAAFIKNYKIAKSPDEPLTGNYCKRLESVFKKIDLADYKNSLTEIESFLNDYPTDVNGKYYRGFIFYQVQDNDNALAEMTWVISRHDKFFYDDARWYKALILNRTKKTDEAKKILSELASQNSSYSNKANQLLELMEK